MDEGNKNWDGMQEGTILQRTEVCSRSINKIGKDKENGVKYSLQCYNVSVMIYQTASGSVSIFFNIVEKKKIHMTGASTNPKMIALKKT